jgi:nicotinamidase-related amidase
MYKLFNKKSALILIDIQNDYFEGGLQPLNNVEEALENAKRLLDYFRKENLPIIHIRHININEASSFFFPNSKGSEIHELLSPRDNETVIIKHKPDSFLATELENYLVENKIENLIICGMMSHMCIDTTVRSASNRYNISLIHDACATKDLYFKGQVIESEIVHKSFMASLSFFSRVLSTSEILNDDIKSISKQS